MTWCSHQDITTATTKYQFGSELLLRLNALFDPDNSGSTHQPYGMDQMAALYDKYIVHSARIVVVAQAPASTANTAIAFSVQPSSSPYTLVGAILQDVSEKPQNEVAFLDSVGTPSRSEFTFAMWQIQGTTKQQYRDEIDLNAALVTANPSQTPFLRIATTNVQSTSAIALSTLVRIEFECEFFQRTILAASS